MPQAAAVLKLMCPRGFALSRGWARYDFHVPAECGQECHQALHRVFAEVALEKPGHFRLADAHEGASLGLRELARAGQPVEFGNDLRFQEMGLCVGQAKIGEDIVSAFVNFNLRVGH